MRTTDPGAERRGSASTLPSAAARPTGINRGFAVFAAMTSVHQEPEISSVRIEVEQVQLVSEVGQFWPRAIGLQSS